jgi:ParB-like chromosome segregation protein Spo0J
VSTGEIVELPVQRITPGPKVRAERIDIDHARRLIPVLDACPPIKVRQVGDGFQLVDGQHRLSAAKFDNRATVRGVVLALTDAEAFVEAVKSNHGHGLPLTLSERTAAAKEMLRLDPEWSDRVIAEACALSPTTIGDLRPTVHSGQLDGKRTGADGKRRPASKADQQAQRKLIAELLTEHPDWSLNRVALEAKASTMTVASVRAEMQQSKKSPGVGSGGPSPVEPPAPAGDAPDDDRGEVNRGSAARHLTPVPPPVGDDAESAPAVGESVGNWPAPGDWIKEPGFDTSNAARDLARLLDRRLIRLTEVEQFEEHARAVPAGAEAAVISALRTQTVYLLDLIHEIENRPTLEAAK